MIEPQPNSRPWPMRWLANAALFGVSLLIALGIAEVVTRIWFPVVSVAQRTDESGEPVKVLEEGGLYQPNLRFRQVSSEYDAWNTIARLGHRVPEVEGSPEIVFLGDSFTFGYGVDDADTFVAMYCARAGTSCGNLGREKTGTGEQMDIATRFLGLYQWRPRELNLFILAMTGSLLGGNDLTDNLRYGQPSQPVAGGENVVEIGRSGSNSLTDFFLRNRGIALRSSNLLRLVYLKLGPELRRRMAPESQGPAVAVALRRTRIQLARLAELAGQYGFEARIFIFHPMQDILRGTDGETLAAIQEIAPPGIPVTSTAEVLRDDPHAYYFPYDGHLNPRGHARIVELLERAAPQPPP
jgi:hypothetical protein